LKSNTALAFFFRGLQSVKSFLVIVVQITAFFFKSKVYIKKITYQYVLKSGFLFCFQKSNYFADNTIKTAMHIAIAGNIGAGKTSLTELFLNIMAGKLILKM